MHPSILIKRKAEALNRILAKAAALVQRIKLDPALTDALQPKGIKDPQVLEMMRLEALADLFDQLAWSAGIEEPAPAVTVVTEPDSKPMEESVPGPVPPGILEELPAPVIETAPAVAAEPEAEPVSEEESEAETEEAPAALKKSTSSRSKRSAK